MNVVWEKPRDTYADVPLGGVFAFIMSNRASNSVLSIKCENGFVRMGDWLFTEWSDKVPSEAEEKVIMYDSELKIHERE